MSEGAKQREIIVVGETCQVWFVQTGKTTWLAYGQYNGKTFEATSRSSGQDAISKWRDKAEWEAIQ